MGKVVDDANARTLVARGEAHARRFHWSAVLLGVQIVGFVKKIRFLYLIWLTFNTNSYASPTIDREGSRARARYHGALRLCAPQTPAYSVRTGATHSSSASWWGLLVRGFIVLLGIRAVLEERTLKQRPDGYPDYTKRFVIGWFRLFGSASRLE